MRTVRQLHDGADQSRESVLGDQGEGPRGDRRTRDELDRGEISLRRMTSGEQQSVKLGNLAAEIQTIISKEEKGNNNS